MFKALMGGGRSSSDARSSSTSKSSSRRRRTDSRSSTVSRKSSRGDDRDRGLGDLSTYPSSGNRSRRYAASATGESVASSYATADQGLPAESDRIVIERTPKRSDSDITDRRTGDRDNGEREDTYVRRRERARSPSRERERMRLERDERRSEVMSGGRDSDRAERRRTQSGDSYATAFAEDPPTSRSRNEYDISGLPPHSAHSYDSIPSTSVSGLPNVPAFYDPHVQQQFPDQFPTTFAEPYRPPNPAGEAADYYGDQGQSVQDQPGVRPKPQMVIPSSQAHLMTASSVPNPPPEPSSLGQVGAAASYYDDDAVPVSSNAQQGPTQSISAPATKPQKPPKPFVQVAEASPPAVVPAASVATAEFSEPVYTESPSTYAPPNPPIAHNPSPPHGMGASVGAAAAGAAAGYVMGHHHHSSSVHSSQYTMQNYEELSQTELGHGGLATYPPHQEAALHAAGVGYAASPLHPHHAAVYHGAPFHSGALAFQQRQRGPLEKIIDFWRDTEAVGMFEDYTESIGICKYCFEPGTSSRDAPRKHNHGSGRSQGDRYSTASRIDKASRYSSSDDEGRRRKRSSGSSWLPGLLGGYAVKSIFSNKEFDESYSIQTGRVASSRHSSHSSEGASTSGQRSQTSRGVHRRSNRSRSREGADRSSYSDTRTSKYETSHVRSRSRSRSSSRAQRHSALRDAALGAALGTATLSQVEPRHETITRVTSSKNKQRKTSSSDESFVDISRPARKSMSSGLSSFFTASSENRQKQRTKKRRGLFSFNNSSSSSLDADLAFGSGFARKPKNKSNRRNRKERDVDTALLSLGAAATALAASSHRSSRRRGEILAGKDPRSGRSDYASSATNDDGWEDLDSGDQSSSSVNSALAFGGSGLFSSSESQHSSDSQTNRWTWGWGSKKKTKKKKKNRTSSSQSEHRLPSGAAVAAGLGTAALASAYHRDAKSSSHGANSVASLQQMAPMPINESSPHNDFDISSMPLNQPPLVRPGPIPLQQPQPVTPVSQAVYTSQGESIHAYSAPSGLPVFEESIIPHETRFYDRSGDPRTNRVPEYDRQSEMVSNGSRAHRRSDSSPVFPTAALEEAPVSGVQRRSTTKEQASVQFDLTDEQADKERRSTRQEELGRVAGYQNGVQLVDREQELASWESEHRASRHRDRNYDRRGSHDGHSHHDRDPVSWVGAAATGTIGAAVAATVLSGRGSYDEASEAASQRRHEERREKRRAERRRIPDSSSTASSLPLSEESKHAVEERPQTERRQESVKTHAFKDLYHKKPVYDNYAQFFAPEELRYSPDTYKRREPTSMPTIIEAEPAIESLRLAEESHPEYSGLPWPVPALKLIEPTPPQSLSGSVKGASSPITLVPARPQASEHTERPTTGSRVSWGRHETHEYEVPSTSSELSVEDFSRREEQDRRGEPSLAQDVYDIPEDFRDVPRSGSMPHVSGADIEFAAAVAAATAAAGFDPSLVTDDPTYHTTRTSAAPEAGTIFVSPWDNAEHRRTEPHGFVEGEVETPDDDGYDKEIGELSGRDHSISPEHEPPNTTMNKDAAPRISIAQEVIEQLSQRQEPKDTLRRVFETSGSKPTVILRGPRDEFAAPVEEVLSMPGGFDTGAPLTQMKTPSDWNNANKDDSRSVVSAPVLGDIDAPTRQEREEQSESDSGPNEDDKSSLAEAGASDKRRKRRKRRTKRDSDHSENTASAASSLTRLGDTAEKSRKADEKDKEKRSGGFLSNLFGSRVSEPIASSSSSADRRSSREVQSEVGPRRKEKSSRRRSSSRADSLDNKSETRKSRDLDDQSLIGPDKENINLENYKSSRQRREGRRRQRYDDVLDSGRLKEYEKV
ncbi:hypothetical protein ASPACDRAFT_21880 [Aspergillus aculeatus ATCC 16872]|uniref:Involucrin repeat protein n=1 Tax=Aspergillus aculeatus (strain ATCC 16872 / CBS 172.66 / WB 5094) TaxID=690307 RepID=A0A1L9X4W9_ASPA1|nr:uncharacterized protein ASPACDRAFT_21880 [Aspergillus aculeatus ATCC 16872]OJK03369.1 hypothetical protein ASPACDRAFT_21880 [Aspergillus aculeatus ATCC 16872]